MKTLLLIALTLANFNLMAYDWDFVTLEYCTDYDPASFDADLDFDLKCIDEEGKAVYFEDYLIDQEDQSPS